MHKRKVIACTLAALFASLVLVTGYGIVASTSGLNGYSGVIGILDNSGLQSKGSGETVTIIRDIYGIPHINASTQQGAYFGFGYAQCEDAIESVMLNLLSATGTLSKTFGPYEKNNTWTWSMSRGYYIYNIESDVLLMQLGVTTNYTEYLGINETMREIMIEPFVAGINYYIYEHWDSLPSWIKENAPVQPTAVASMGNLINWIFSATLLTDWMTAEYFIKSMGVSGYLNYFQTDTGPYSLSKGSLSTPHFSNEWVVSNDTSGTGNPMYLCSPQIGWDGVLQWYEGHLMAPAQVHDSVSLPELNIMGAIFLGLPFMGVGHNNYIAWSETVNQPDIGDVWIENLTTSNTHYYYNGTTLPLEQRTITLPVKVSGLGVITQEITAYYTRHGVIMTLNTTDHWALAINYSAYKPLQAFEQWYLVNTAQNRTQFKNGLAILGTAMFNIMFASVYNETYYVWNAMCPRRNESYNWNNAVPGWVNYTDWGDLITFAELPQQEDPTSGWMQNCNIPAWNITTQPNNITDTNTSSPYPRYLVNWYDETGGTYQGMNNYTRGYHVFQIFNSVSPITLDFYKQLAFNNSLPYFASDCINTLPDNVFGTGNETLNNTIHTLKNWDMYATNQTAMTIFKLWMYNTSGAIPANESYAITTLNNTINYMQATYGTTEVYWADVHYVVRGSYKVGLNGTSGYDLVSPRDWGCLNARWEVFNSATGEWEVYQGNSIMFVVNMEKDNVTSWSCVPYGNSNDPTSPHYADMLLNWFSKDLLHPDFFYMSDILANNESITDKPVKTLDETIQLINMLPFMRYITLWGIGNSIAGQQVSSSLMMGGIAVLILIICVAGVAIAARRP